MKDKTKELLAEVNAEHDWQMGQVYSGGGTKLSSTDTCRICSLRRHFLDDFQNGIKAEYRFSDGETNQDLSLRQAVARKCLVSAAPEDCGISKSMDRKLVLAIQRKLDGQQWTPETLEEIADALRSYGFEVRDCNAVTD